MASLWNMVSSRWQSRVLVACTFFLMAIVSMSDAKSEIQTEMWLKEIILSEMACDGACDVMGGYCDKPEDGSEGCKCKQGWEGDGITCENINECLPGGIGEAECNKRSAGPRECVDTLGSFTCECKPGYIHAVGSTDGSCVEDNVCSRGQHSCLPHIATCSPVRGSSNFTCACLPGFNGDGLTKCENMCDAGIAQRLNCYPDGEPSEDICTERGCCWSPYTPPQKDKNLTAGARQGLSSAPDSAVPPCFYPLPANSYILTSVERTKSTLTGTLECSSKFRHGDGTGGGGRRPHNIGAFGSEICPLKLSVAFETDERVRVRIFDPNTPRWEVPSSFFPPETKKTGEGEHVEASSEEDDYVLSYTTDPFGFAITRVSTRTVIINTTQVSGLINGLSFEEQFWSLSTVLEDSPLLYGLGQQKAPLLLPTGEETGINTYTLWARDPGGTPDHNPRGASSLYGSHPFWMQVMKSDGAAHGVFVRSSNAMDVVLSPNTLTLRGTGGIIDLSIFLGPAPKDVIMQYTEVIGRPHMPPFWALGFHMCRWGYGSVRATRAVVDRMRQEGLPQDSQWNDIDYMREFRDFTLDPQGFPPEEVAAMVADLHANGQRYVMIVDAAIGANAFSDGTPDTALLQGLDMDVFIKSKSGDPLRGWVWPGPAVFPDFMHPNASAYWELQLRRWRMMVDFDGIWCDMNEPSNFCDGECPSGCTQQHQQQQQGVGPDGQRSLRAGHTAQSGGQTGVCDATEEQDEDILRRNHIFAPWKLRSVGGKKFDPAHPPYIPGGAASLDVKTVSMSSWHCVMEDVWRKGRGEACTPVLHYDCHNLYGVSEARVTAAVTQDMLARRPLIISRSTFPGSGRYGGTWLGDTDSTWGDMKLSISGMLTMGLFGIPLVGADVCGFQHNTTRELCIRWHQLGSMYPFSRNHNDIAAAPQEPYAFDEEALAIIRRALLIRYTLTPYMYTAFDEARLSGVPVARALFMEFPGVEDLASLAHIDEQFLIGSSLLVSPILHEGATSVSSVFPRGRWYDFYTGVEVPGDVDAVRRVDVDAPLASLPLHIRGGHIIPIQQPAMTTDKVRKSPFTLMVAFGKDSRAVGKLFLDDGESIKGDAKYSMVKMLAVEEVEGVRGNVTTYVWGTYSPKKDPKIVADVLIEKVVIYGLGPDYVWGFTSFTLGEGAPLPNHCIQEEPTSSLVRVWIGGIGCGKHHVIMNPMQLRWNPMVEGRAVA